MTNKVWTEEEIEENRWTFEHLKGQAVGWSQAAGWLREKAGEKFKADKDQEARSLRNLADEALEKSKESLAEAKTYEKEYCQ